MVLAVAWAVCVVVTAASGSEREKGLVAHYGFDEGTGTVLKDASGNGSHGAIHGATWHEVPGGHALAFDGVDDFVDCGKAAALDVRGPITLTAWICPAGHQPAREPGVLGKQFSSFLLTYYWDRRCYWYINSGANHAEAAAGPGVWSHVAATFDGNLLRIYVNGEPAARQVSKHKTINQGGNFLIGALSGDPAAEDPNYRASGAYKGMIDEVKLYNRALADEEIRAEFQSPGFDRNRMFAVECVPVSTGSTIRRGDVSVTAGPGGAVQINNRGSFCVIQSSFSFPGDRIGYNWLASGPVAAEDGWKPGVRKVDDGALSIRAEGDYYRLERSLQLVGDRLQISDTLSNRQDTPVGILVAHRIVAPQALDNIRIGTTADNPTIFFSQPGGDFGLVGEDDVSRLRFEATGVTNNVTLLHTSFALDAGKSHTFRYTVYLLEPTGDRFVLINRLRRDWKTNFTVEGPMDWLDAAPGCLMKRDALRQHIQRRNLKVVNLLPWLDYDPGSMDHVMTRDQYKAMAWKAAERIREVCPGTKVLGCIETDWVTIYPEKIEGGELITSGTQAQVTRVIDAAELPWQDSVKRDVRGHLSIERYHRGGKPQFALGVYPAPGNYQHRFLLEQARFLIEDVGLDGLYIDEFSQAWSRSVRSYTGSDGVSADVDPATGRIREKFVDCSLVGIPSRVELIDYVRSRGKIIFANTYATSRREQSLPVFRFWEMQAFLDLSFVQRGKEPPLVPAMCQGVLASPLGLGVTAVGEKPGAEGLMLGMMSYLRHGLLYCHYSYPALPQTGPTSGQYGPINHMYPMTPVELHKGWMKGKQRIVACVSFQTDWDLPREPNVLLFDLAGRQANGQGKVRLTGQGGQWHVEAGIDDWTEFLVLE